MSTATRHENKVLLVLTLIIGAVVGLVVVAFILLTERLGARLYPADAAAWRRLVIPVVGSLSAGIMLARYFPNARGSGIPQTKIALFIRDGYISLRTVLGKFGLCSVTLASGIALGREGPSVQIGAGIASVIGRRLGLSTTSIKALAPIGASAALAAAFNTPIAAVLFSLEEVMGDMHAPVLGSIVLSSATSWIVLHLLLGDEPLFHVPAYQLVHPIEFGIYAVLGAVGGLVSVAFVKLLLWQRKYFLNLPKQTLPLQPVFGGLVVGILGWYFPNVLGVGYGIVGQALNSQMFVGAMALLTVLKLVATASCYASGNAGGIFGPSLFIGAMMGGAIGGVAHNVFPDYTGSAGAYALVGMGAAFAGIVRVPMTSVIMIFEMTRDYSIIVPLMISNLISYYISARLQDEPIYEALQHQDGIHLPSGARARDALLMVGNAFRSDAEVLAATQTVADIAGLDRQRGAWPVVDDIGLRGMVTAAQLDAASPRQTLAELVSSPGRTQSLTAENFPHLHIDHPLDVAMRRIAESGLPALPVVSRDNVRQLKGTVSVPDILAAYAVGHAQDAEADAPRTPPHVLGRMLAALIVVALLTGGLNYFLRHNRGNRADRYYDAATQLLAKDRIEEAIEQYRNAVSVSHTVRARLGLSAALIKAGRLSEASVYLDEVLREDPASGPANLGMARILAQRGEIDQAAAAYRRAIAAGENPLETRAELVDMLAKAGRTADAQAELRATLASTPESDTAARKRVGYLLIHYGAPQDAISVFHDLTRRNRRDASAFDGLGQAESAVGNDRAACAAFRSALRLDPSDALAASKCR
jgi:chloride channel protein, CIC family